MCLGVCVNRTHRWIGRGDEAGEEAEMVLVVSVSICMDGGAFYGGTVMLLAVSEELSSHHRSPQEQSRCLSFAVTKPPDPPGGSHAGWASIVPRLCPGGANESFQK